MRCKARKMHLNFYRIRISRSNDVKHFFYLLALFALLLYEFYFCTLYYTQLSSKRVSWNGCNGRDSSSKADILSRKRSYAAQKHSLMVPRRPMMMMMMITHASHSFTQLLAQWCPLKSIKAAATLPVLLAMASSSTPVRFGRVIKTLDRRRLHKTRALARSERKSFTAVAVTIL